MAYDKGVSVTAAALELLRQYPTDVIGAISARDHMYSSAPWPSREQLDNAYLSLGRAALDCIRIVLLAAQRDNVESILDLPSGHGRVLRILKAEFPASRITACDIWRDAVDFCARTFGASPLYGQEHPADLECEDQFDLIWCGSLLTHLDAPTWHEFFDFFEHVLAPEGLLVVTTHGRSIAAKLREPETGQLWIEGIERQRAIVASYEASGFGFAEYPTSEEDRRAMDEPSRYGVSLSHPRWVCDLVDGRSLQIMAFMENRWGAQDVIGLMKVDRVEEGATSMKGATGGIRRPRPELYQVDG